MAKEQETSDFASRGFEAVRNTYIDSLQLSSLTDDKRWTDVRLDSQIEAYDEFLKNPKLMPNARQTGQRNREHMNFERDCRMGKYALQSLDFIEEVDDCPTEAIDPVVLQDLLKGGDDEEAGQ